MSMMNRLWCLLGLLCATAPAAAEFDYRLAPRQVAEDTYVVVGKTEDFNRSNGGNIVNTAFVVTSEGVVVIDTGPSLRYGEQLKAAIAKITDKPVVRAFNTHHHPDHFLGNQVFAGFPIAALPATIQGQKQNGTVFAENVFRMAGDWIKGTEPQAANLTAQPGMMNVGNHAFELIAMTGHTAGDLVILDRTTGVLFVGDLVFFNRAPTTPHASLAEWLAALTKLESIGHRIMVPGHGEPVPDGRAIEQTRRYLYWIDRSLRDAAERGIEMTEILAQSVPAEFSRMPLAREEFARSVAHLYRRYEAATLQRTQ